MTQMKADEGEDVMPDGKQAGFKDETAYRRACDGFWTVVILWGGYAVLVVGAVVWEWITK